METSFFSGSENLYKYLVTMGLLLMVLTVYYPLKEKQELEIVKIQLENDVKSLNYKIKENAKSVNNLRVSISKGGTTIENKELLQAIDKLNNDNHLSQIESEKKFAETTIRAKYIKLYNVLFWLFFPIGIFLTVFGFIKWKNSKKFDDNILKLENEKLEIEVERLKQDKELSTSNASDVSEG